MFELDERSSRRGAGLAGSSSAFYQVYLELLKQGNKFSFLERGQYGKRYEKS
jgi:hypothetical protein